MRPSGPRKERKTIMQKYEKGDFVHVVKDLGPMMSHFEKDCDAIVMYSYAEKYGGDQRQEKKYCIHIKGHGEVAWYYESQLKLIEKNRIDLLKKWESEKKAEEKQKSNLDWIFDNGKDVLNSAHGATVSALAKCLGCSNLWGSHGEGFVYYQNAMAVLKIAKPFLKKSDKSGWITFSKEYKTAQEDTKERGQTNPQQR